MGELGTTPLTTVDAGKSGAVRALCLSDIHSDFAAFDPAQMPDADLCLVAGDVTEYGHAHPRVPGIELGPAREWLGALGARFPTFVIPGNHDIRVVNADWEYIPGVTPLLNRRAECLGLSLYGISLSPAHNAPRMARMFDYMTADRDVEEAAYDAIPPVDIIISHAPPYGTLDRMWVNHKPLRIGSEPLARVIAARQPKLVVCGHVHYDTGKATIGHTLVVNAAKRAVVVSLATSLPAPAVHASA